MRSLTTASHFRIPDLSLIRLIDSRNAASIKLALAVGATLEPELEFAGGPFHVYRHPLDKEKGGTE